MSLHIYLLAAAFLAGLCGGSKSESFFFGLNEMEACLQKAPVTMKCRDKVCVLKKCLKLGYDLLFESSSLNKNHDFPRAAHCAIDQCTNGVMGRKDSGGGLFSGIMEPVVACLQAVRSCAKNNPRDEL